MECVGHLEQRQQERHHKLPLAVVAYQVSDDVAVLVGIFMFPVGCPFAATITVTTATGGGIVVVVVTTIGGGCGGILHPVASAIRGWGWTWDVVDATTSAVGEC